MRYGGNTSCVEVRSERGEILIFDAGTGIRPLGEQLAQETGRIDLLLSHLHMDHILGLGFFAPLFEDDREVHIWGPVSTTMDIRARLTRYLSPPLFPVRLRDLPCRLTLHDAPVGSFRIGNFDVSTALVCHPGPTLGFRIEEEEGRALVYMSDHEPALGFKSFPLQREWTSGLALAEGASVLIHDAQYGGIEYAEHVGWGHSAIEHTLHFAEAARAERLVTFHHDPSHNDAALDEIHDSAHAFGSRTELLPGVEGLQLEI
jgi:phosphoribosyl 1,2-cyclic phosphodiesterase